MSGRDQPVAELPELPEVAWWVAIASLPGLGPAGLSALFARWPSGATAWDRLASGRAAGDPGLADYLSAAVRNKVGPSTDAIARRWMEGTQQRSVAQVWAAHVSAGIGAVLLGRPGYPDALADVVGAPVVLFWRGDPDVLDGPRVAIVGTRRATRQGIEVAYELGRDLAAAGVRVVSGLALGIDGAAHRGSLAADVGPPVAVVGSGLDVVYPPRHRELWGQVAAAGVVFSEAPLGASPERWRFPARNRLLAALGDLVVVVESARKGGAMGTARLALDHGGTVMAVPGPVRSPVSEGTNDLLFEGAGPVRDAADVLGALGLEAGSRREVGPRRPRPSAPARAVLDALGWQPATLQQLVERSQRPFAEVAAAITELEDGQWLGRADGWFERLGSSR